MMSLKEDLTGQFGDIDIYLFDQLLKGRFDNRASLLDAGCGKGRNLVYFLRNGFDVYAVDRDPDAVDRTRKRVARLAPQLPKENVSVAELDDMTFEDDRFDAVICNAVLHFAKDEAHFHRMLDEMWRVLKKDGLLFIRLASNIGLEDRLKQLYDRCSRMPDGKKRFLVDEAILMETTKRLGGKLLDPIKTTIVQNLRCMTTWCLRKTQ
ncbi:MAG: class I SAM-dependent methyltransferase [bacterium]|nr:class I SAM-dependent methyltransferase [bacterium]